MESKPIKIFISYSHKDETMKDRFLTYISPLKKTRNIEIWEDRVLMMGQHFNLEINNNLLGANIIICLVSADYLNSNYCQEIELKIAIEKEKNHKAVILPVLLHECMWDDTVLKDFSIFPRDAKPIGNLDNAHAFCEVAKGVTEVIDHFNELIKPDDVDEADTVTRIAKAIIKKDEKKECDEVIKKFATENDPFKVDMDVVKDINKLVGFAEKYEHFREEIFNTLCAHVRKKSNLDEKIVYVNGRRDKLSETLLTPYLLDKQWRNLSMEQKKLKKISYDVQLVFEILFKDYKDIFCNYKADFSNSMLINIDLSGMSIKNANFSNCCMQFARMYSNEADNVISEYVNCDFTGVLLDGANMANSDLSGSTFVLAKMRFANFFGCKLLETNFMASDITGGLLSKNEIFANFNNSILDGTEISDLRFISKNGRKSSFNKVSLNFAFVYCDIFQNDTVEINPIEKYGMETDRRYYALNRRITRLLHYRKKLLRKDENNESIIISINRFNKIVGVVKDYIVENSYGEDLSALKDLQEISISDYNNEL